MSKKKIVGLSIIASVIIFAIVLIAFPDTAFALNKAWTEQIQKPGGAWLSSVWAGISANPIWQNYGVAHAFSFLWGVVFLGGLIVLWRKLKPPIFTKKPEKPYMGGPDYVPPTALASSSAKTVEATPEPEVAPKSEPKEEAIVKETEEAVAK